jgi:hypothetical protein
MLHDRYVTVVRVQVTWSDETHYHEFSGRKAAARFMESLVKVPVERILRGMSNVPSLPSFTASLDGVFVRAESFYRGEESHINYISKAGKVVCHG